MFIRCSSWFVQRASLTVNIDLSDVTNRWLHSTVPYSRGIWEKESIIGVQWFPQNPNPLVHRSVGNSASHVSHWNGGPSGWDLSVPIEHQWWILFIWEFSMGQKFISYPCYLTQAITRGMSIGCNGTHAHGCQETQTFSQCVKLPKYIMLYLVKAWNNK